MSSTYSNEPMMEMFIFETTQLLEQLELMIIAHERDGGEFSPEAINEIFRIMHTIKGSSAMMLLTGISTLSHSVEDMFYILREKKPVNVDHSRLSDIVLECLDFIRLEVGKLEKGFNADGDPAVLTSGVKAYADTLKGAANTSNTTAPAQTDSAKAVPADSTDNSPRYYIGYTRSSSNDATSSYKATIFFEDGCEMENIRAFGVVHSLKEISDTIFHIPENIIEDSGAIDAIRKDGFVVYFTSPIAYDATKSLLEQTVFLRSLELEQLQDDTVIQSFNARKMGKPANNAINIPAVALPKAQQETADSGSAARQATQSNVISMNIHKVDMLMDLVGELVVSESMVTQNPDLDGLTLDNFYKAARQHRKIIGELQDIAMSLRMTPVSGTFQKMNRIIRDVEKKLGKEINLTILGEETEVDKNIIENISDPLMHLVRNAADHGIESPQERIEAGKPANGTIVLEARNAGGEVCITVKDDGRGLNREKILKKAAENGLLTKPESEITDKEAFSYIFLPGFSTKENVTEFSGRGVGMDVVCKNVEKIGGSVSVDSARGHGSIFTIKIPLTLAIISGMTIGVGKAKYTIPMTSIQECFRPEAHNIITDPDGREMIMIRGKCHSIIRLHERFAVRDTITDFTEGIIIMIDNMDKSYCLFADHLIGEQQVVVKALPKYIKKVNGLAGCAILGDGSISLILDIEQLYT